MGGVTDLACFFHSCVSERLSSKCFKPWLLPVEERESVGGKVRLRREAASAEPFGA